MEYPQSHRDGILFLKLDIQMMELIGLVENLIGMHQPLKYFQMRL